MKKYIYIFLFFIILIISCINDTNVKNIEIQGHRGVRGYAPENTIEGFLKALEYDIDVLEMDVVISGDGQFTPFHTKKSGNTIAANAVIPTSPNRKKWLPKNHCSKMFFVQ